jgi:hypothetical protein
LPRPSARKIFIAAVSKAAANKKSPARAPLRSGPAGLFQSHCVGASRSVDPMMLSIKTPFFGE